MTASVSKNWEQLDAEFGGELSALVREIRSGPHPLGKTHAITLALLFKGYSEEHIAEIRGFSMETVYNHVSVIRHCFGISRDVRFHDMFKLIEPHIHSLKKVK